MKLILSKSQKSGLTGKISYVLEIKADLTKEEKDNIAKYRMGDAVLYSSTGNSKTPTSALGILKQVALSTVIKVSDLTNGKKIEVKDFMEIMAAEDQVKTACQGLKNILEAMATFDGEQVIEI